MHRGVFGCAEAHGQVCSGTWRCAEVHIGMCRGVWGTEVCRGEKKVTEVHRCMWSCIEGSQRYMEGCMEVHTPLCTSAHLCIPLHTPAYCYASLCTSAHLCTPQHTSTYLCIIPRWFK